MGAVEELLYPRIRVHWTLVVVCPNGHYSFGPGGRRLVLFTASLDPPGLFRNIMATQSIMSTVGALEAGAFAGIL